MIAADERAELRRLVSGWKPRMTVEVRVDVLVRVLDALDGAAPLALQGAWEKQLVRESDGTPKNWIANVLTVLRGHPAFVGVLSYDLTRDRVVKLRKPPVRTQDGESELGDWTWADSIRTAAWFASTVGFSPSPTRVQQSVDAAAGRAHVRKRRPV